MLKRIIFGLPVRRLFSSRAAASGAAAGRDAAVSVHISGDSKPFALAQSQFYAQHRPLILDAESSATARPATITAAQGASAIVEHSEEDHEEEEEEEEKEDVGASVWNARVPMLHLAAPAAPVPRPRFTLLPPVSPQLGGALPGGLGAPLAVTGSAATAALASPLAGFFGDWMSRWRRASIRCASVLRKRRKKMNKHKHRKFLKKNRITKKNIK